jgi:hypothetical protein
MGPKSVSCMSPKNQEDEWVVAEAIINYLADCPLAMDTEEGIAEWWLMRRQAKVAAQSVTKVLKHMIENGQIEIVRVGKHQGYRLKSH